jgi:UDP:flavonoid glycosyltransferase YjiC (YdhE family)
MLAKHFNAFFEIRFAYSPTYAHFVQEEGYQTFLCKSMDPRQVMDCVKNFDFSWVNEQSLDVVFSDQVKVIQRLNPVAVLGDTSLTLKMAAEKTGVTYIALMNGYMSKHYAFTRKLSRTHPVYRFVSILSGQLLDMITQKGEAIAFYKLHRPFKKIRSANGLAKKNTYLDELEGDVNLICDLETMFPQKALPSGYSIIAPLYFDTEIIYSQIALQPDPQKRTIFVTMGSTGDWQNVAFLNNAYFRKFNIVTAGDSGKLINAPGIVSLPFVNIHELFHVTDLVICQGGNGTIYQSLLYAIPVLCKTNNFEQEYNVEAVERLQAGRSLDSITELNDHINIIEEWIGRKNSGPLEALKHQVRKKADSLEADIKNIAGNLVKACINC